MQKKIIYELNALYREPMRVVGYAFGDGENDIEMLATVGCGIAMGNAAKAVKAHAKKVTDSVSQDGVASGIEKYILGTVAE